MNYIIQFYSDYNSGKVCYKKGSVKLVDEKEMFDWVQKVADDKTLLICIHKLGELMTDLSYVR